MHYGLHSWRGLKHQNAVRRNTLTDESLATRSFVGEDVPRDLAPAQLGLAERFLLPFEEAEGVETRPARDTESLLRALSLNAESALVDNRGNEILLTAGNLPNAEDDIVPQALNAQLQSLDLYDHTVFAADTDDPLTSWLDNGGKDTASDSNIDLLDDIEDMGGLDNESDGEEELLMNDGSTLSDQGDDWYPHGSKTMLALDMLDNFPRLRLSDDHLKAIIWAMRMAGTPNVPSFAALRKKQAEMVRSVKVDTAPQTSCMGNHFYMNKPSTLLAMDWANPMVRELIHLYPEVTTSISESWQAGKWVEEIDLKHLTPMWADFENAPHHHFYVNELARLMNGQYVIPRRWITCKSVEYVEVYAVHLDASTNLFVVNDSVTLRVEAHDLQDNWLELQASLSSVQFCELSASWMAEMPHPTRAIANGRPVFTLFLIPWSDDVSGNVSKQYNAHLNVYLVNGNIPHRYLAQEYFVRFCATSPHASALEQMNAVRQDMAIIPSGPENYHTAFDCKLETEILFRIIPHLAAADNPQQSELSSHIGMQGNKYCRRCDVGGTDEHKETDEGYRSLYKAQTARKPNETASAIKSQIKIAALGVQEAVTTLQTKTGVKDKIAEYWIGKAITRARELQAIRLTNPATRDLRLRSRNLKGDARVAVRLSIQKEIQKEVISWLITQPEHSYAKIPSDSPLRNEIRAGDHYSPLLDMPGLDVHRDTPVEILHTYLLGQDKYMWHLTNNKWDSKQEQLFTARLQSSSVDGLSTPAIRASYMIRYKNSLIGKHFKILQQLGVFHLHDKLCDPLVFDLWKATGELGALLWYHTISDLESYLKDLDILIHNVLDIWALIDPARIIVKPKLHILEHLVDDIRRFGPAILYSTEIFECWNAIFRTCSVLSNHASPSHDIAVTIADMERFKHQVSGGWWRNLQGQYVQAGPEVRSLLRNNAQIQRRLGWVNLSNISPATVKPCSQQEQNPASWHDALGTLSVARPFNNPRVSPGRTWHHCKYVVSREKDICKPGSWVFFQSQRASDTNHDEIQVGRIFKILSPEAAFASKEQTVVIGEVFDVLGERNARLNMPILRRQCGLEVIQIVSPKDILFIFNAQHDCGRGKCAPGRDLQSGPKIQHSDDNAFIINLHALHNAIVLRESLPRHLTEPQPYLSDRAKVHQEIAARLRVTGPAKRAAAVAKAAETRARNAKGKESNSGSSQQVNIGSGTHILQPVEEAAETVATGSTSDSMMLIDAQ
ncbi:hypothetical protein EVG20_g8108 [Dentipellis fragilis]|uniref:Uncharacterized protein n=1 Tax=Dentipellis fragilis TaxID=205917 RepID=A0A4Y9YAF3_9AGAM|nr:hypothetical protein EVG20_g8108 [Dentipellis fragilis]